MIDIQWYLLTVGILVLFAACWATVANSGLQTGKERLQYLAGTTINCAISISAYWALVFVLSLVLAAGIWLVLLLLIWVPSDFFQNYLGSNVFTDALQNIRPAIFKSASSPGMTHIPLLDYVSLSAAYVLGPWLGIWSILRQEQQPPADINAQPQN